MWRRTPLIGDRQSTVGQPVIPAMRSAGGCASALRRCSAGPRRLPASARPVTAALPVSAGCSRRRPLPTTSSDCPSWLEPWDSHARNLPRHRKNRRNRRKDLLDDCSSTTQARATFENSTNCSPALTFPHPAKVLLGGHPREGDGVAVVHDDARLEVLNRPVGDDDSLKKAAIRYSVPCPVARDRV